MPYSKVLSELINKSNLTLREIAKRCEDLGKPINYSYISQLKTGKINPPSDEISKVLAQILNIDPNILILEAYLDKAPKLLIDKLEEIKVALNNYIDQQIHNNDILKKVFKDEPLSKFLLSFNSKNFSIPGNALGKLTMRDDSMSPIIRKNSKLIISTFSNHPEEKYICDINPAYITLIGEKYEKFAKEFYADKIGFSTHARNGDIVAAWDLDEDILLIRTCHIEPEHGFYLLPINGKYKPKYYTFSETFFNGINVKDTVIEKNKNFIEFVNKEHHFKFEGKHGKIKIAKRKVCILGKIIEICNSTESILNDYNYSND